MRSVYRPHLVLSGPGDAHGRVHVPHLDEDELTLAVDAAQPLLDAAGIDPAKLQGVSATSTTNQGWSSGLAEALGLSHAIVRELPLAEWELERKAATSKGRPTLWIHSDAPRNTAATGAQAIAELHGAGARAGPDLAPGAHREPRLIDGAFYDKLSEWERRALATVPMGANISGQAWERSRIARYRLLASTCDHCHASHHPPLEPCPTCGRPTKVDPMGRNGSLYSHTVIARGSGPSEFDPWQEVEGEYGVAVVVFGRDLRAAGMISETRLDSLRVGAAFEPVLRRLYAQDGRWRYGIKFRAVGDPGGPR